MTMGDRIHTLRKDNGLTLEDIGRAAGVAKSTVRKWESGSITSIRTDKVQKVAAALGTTLEYLLNGVEDSGALYKNMEPLPQTRPVPVIGNIACGTPIFAEENVEGYAELDIRCYGDSMINAHIFDGDLVFIRKQPDVENGEIAAIVIDGEATLKRVYKYPNRIELRPENPLFPVMQYEDAELDTIRIIGKAVSFLGQVR